MDYEAFVYLWFDSKNRKFYLGSHKGHEDDSYTHSSSVMESFSKQSIPSYMRRRILATGSHEDMKQLENDLLGNRKEKCWDKYYNVAVMFPPPPRYGEDNPHYIHGKWKDPEYKKEYAKEYREKNREKLREYREKNREKIREYDKEYREKNREDLREKKREYYEKNSEKFREYDKEYREKNREKKREYAKEYHEKNREKKIKYSREHYEKNREKRLQYQREYNARKKAEKMSTATLEGFFG